MNKGKNFEAQYKASCEKQGLFCLRLNDTSLSWQKEKNARFTPKNPCDYLTYSYPNLFAIECKSTKYNSIGIQRTPDDPEAMLKAHQIQSLINFSTMEGVYAGLLINFRNDQDVTDNITYFWLIDDFSDFLCESKKNSFNETDIIMYRGFVVDQKLLRTNYLYDIKKMLQDIITCDNKKKSRKEGNNGSGL